MIVKNVPVGRLQLLLRHNYTSVLSSVK